MADPVVPSGLNTLTIPARHLPLGRATDCPAGKSRWTVWIPSKGGGRLAVTLSGATTIEIQETSGDLLCSGTEDVAWSLTSDTWGELVVVADCPAADQIVATFTQIFWSRQAPARSSKPLIPYNFWYWPCSRDGKWANEAIKVLERYGNVVGKTSPSPGEFEKINHQIANAPGWQGHCHNAAPASALFEQPGDQSIISAATEIGGEKFSPDELKLLATEFFGNFGQLEIIWSISPDIDVHARPRFGILAYLKPGAPKTFVALHDNLLTTLKPEAAQTYATDALSSAGGDEAFAAKMEQALGRCGATFFTALVEQIGMQGEPLVVNLRSYNSALPPDEIWNQVCFHCYITYVETEGASDKFDVSVNCNLTSNRDFEPPTMSPPARVLPSGAVDPGTSAQDCMQYFHQLRLIFLGSGTVNESDPRNRWVSIMSSDGGSLFAPTHMQRIIQSRTQRPDVSTPTEDFTLGNPVVGLELLDTLNLNRRFR
jgi:hypothetical protein